MFFDTIISLNQLIIQIFIYFKELSFIQQIFSINVCSYKLVFSLLKKILPIFLVSLNKHILDKYIIKNNLFAKYKCYIYIYYIMCLILTDEFSSRSSFSTNPAKS